MDGYLDVQSEDGRARLLSLFRYSQVGRCVNSVTHDINNLLGAILAYADLIEVSRDLPPDTRRMVSQIIGAVQKSTAIMGGLTMVARKERPDVSMIDLAQSIDQVLNVKRYDFKVERVALETVLEPNLPSLVVDLPRFEMALIYLLGNALEAVEGVKERRVRVSARSLGDQAEIALWNSGPLVPEESREAIFEPFYTTKGGDHMGLGLTLARDAARYHSGDLVYDVDRGFVLRIPLGSMLMAKGSV
jgi:two-component system C4-dicarboxylate transport sensor histidine kinase DctB